MEHKGEFKFADAECGSFSEVLVKIHRVSRAVHPWMSEHDRDQVVQDTGLRIIQACRNQQANPDQRADLEQSYWDLSDKKLMDLYSQQSGNQNRIRARKRKREVASELLHELAC